VPTSVPAAMAAKDPTARGTKIFRKPLTALGSRKWP